MASLNILGTQRIKALTSILNEKKNNELNALRINVSDIQKQAKEQSGLADIELQYRNAQNEYNVLYNKLYQEAYKPRNEIESKYKQKADMLWLCETLEEAKQIVGLE